MMSPRGPRRAPLLLLLLPAAALGAAGCAAVSEHRGLGSALMALDDDPTEAHLRRKAHESREGAAGGYDAGDGGGPHGAGGGCGCY